MGVVVEVVDETINANHLMERKQNMVVKDECLSFVRQNHYCLQSFTSC
jgi:hypothetical protein